MAIQAQNEKLNIVPGGIIPVVHASQYDVDRVLTFTLYDGLSAASLPSGVTGLIEGTKPDNKGFQYAVTSISNNVVTIVTTKQMTAVQGTVKCKIVLLKDTMVLGTALFFLEVDEAGLADDTDISATELPFIRDMAETNMLNAEAWAVGTRNGVPVPSTDETYKNNSKFYAGEAEDSADNAAESEANAATSETNAATSENNAAESEANAATSETNAAASEANAAISAADAKAYADLFFGFLRPKGQITFAELPSAAEALAGDWYVISDAFVTTSDFVVGAGVSIDAGANVYMTVNDKWGIIQGSIVGGVKGAAESTYRSGLVNLSYSNLGTAPIANGGTGLTSSPSMLTNLGSTSAANVLQASPRPGVTGTLGIGNGGTGLTSSPSMLTNLGSTSADNILKASPRPGVTGTLGAGNGGTGYTSLQATRNAMGLGNTTGALPVANGGTGATKAADARSNLGLGAAATYGIGSVASGNTGLVTGGSVFSSLPGFSYNFFATSFDLSLPKNIQYMKICEENFLIGEFFLYLEEPTVTFSVVSSRKRMSSNYSPVSDERTYTFSGHEISNAGLYIYVRINYSVTSSAGGWTGSVSYLMNFHKKNSTNPNGKVHLEMLSNGSSITSNINYSVFCW